MAIRASEVAYKYLTDADFFNINKPIGTEPGGGGQSYLDLGSTATSPISDWHAFFEHVRGVSLSYRTHGPEWTVPVNNIGIPNSPQTISIYQRRPQSISVACQKLNTSMSNRVLSWDPRYGFPRPIDPNVRNQCPRGLVVFLVKAEGVLYPGWLLNDGISDLPIVGESPKITLASMLTTPEGGGAQSGIVKDMELYIDPAEGRLVFSGLDQSTGPSIERGDYSDDEQTEADINMDSCPSDPSIRYSLASIRQRNKAAVRRLKRLYGHTCQITGREFLFPKRNGEYYTEVHHLIPLGMGGADRPENMVVVSPMIHSMLHHAEVGEIDISRATRNTNGDLFLQITISGNEYTIRWHPDHAQIVLNNPQR